MEVNCLPGRLAGWQAWDLERGLDRLPIAIFTWELALHKTTVAPVGPGLRAGLGFSLCFRLGCWNVARTQQIPVAIVFRQGHGQNAFLMAQFQAMRRRPFCFALAGGWAHRSSSTARQTGQDHVHWIEAIARLVDGFASGQ